MKRLLSVLFLLGIGVSVALAQSGEITGTITDEKGESVPFATIAAYQGTALISGASTDFDGNFTIKPLYPGKYDVHVSYVGYAKSIQAGVIVSSDKITTLNVKLKPEDEVLDAVEIIVYKKPLIDKENSGTKQTITGDEIKSLATRNVSSIAANTAGVFQSDEGGELNIKGARTDATQYYIDGIRITGAANLPATAIEELTVLTGGVPAKYGDAVGGIVNITTKGPSRKTGGGVEVITSQFLDPYGYNLVNFNLTGPLWTKDKGTDTADTKVGFFISGEYLHQKDPDPSAVGVWVVNEDKLDELRENPLVASESSDAFIYAAETVTDEDIENVKVKPNTQRSNYSFSGKVDWKASDNVNVTVGGSMYYTNAPFWIRQYNMFNYDNNPVRKEAEFRGFARLTQRFGKSTWTAASSEEGEQKNVFRNAFYTVQIDYSKYRRDFNDQEHGMDPFKYGYLGKYDIYRTPTYEYGADTIADVQGWMLSAYQDTLVTFTASDVNPDLANYTSSYYNLAGDNKDLYYSSLDQIFLGGGLINGQSPSIIHGLWYGLGYPNSYYRLNNDQYRISLNGSVDIHPAGSAERNKHALEFGLEFEQRVIRSYNMKTPDGLWFQMRQLTNRHIDQLDKANPILLIDGVEYAYDDPNAPIFGYNDTVLYERRYDADRQTTFDRNLRSQLGYAVDGTDIINVDALTPEDFSLDLFSPDELMNNGTSVVSYFGYDYTGKREKGLVAFNDFFTEKDENGDFTRRVGAFRPIYTAGYLQDKFNFKDVLFNVGVRVDRYDANQRVLKDRYSLYQVLTVAESQGRIDDNTVIPGNIGDDYVVYVSESTEGKSAVLGYRNGDTWYNENGVELVTPEAIARNSATGQITPLLANPDDDIKSEDFDPNSTFEDYKPQVTVMPRVAFSFSLTDNASFFAHYDVLTQRPPTDNNIVEPITYANPVQWLYFEDNVDGIISNPNLKPEKTIDFQLGYRQLVSQNSALTISAFYRELKDMLQVVSVSYAYPRNYLTFGNVDFGTVKGLAFAYDLRKTKSNNFSMTANYTIQFAEGTGSDSESQENLVRAGQPNLRTIVPLSYDSRHNISISADYSYGDGSDYNGPRVNGKDIFANAGVNLIVRTWSGTPYTQQANATPEAQFTRSTRSITQGSINGSRLPWSFRTDLRIYKDFQIAGKKPKEEGAAPGRPLYLNAYLAVLNILNNKNVISVYRYTGNPDDDGYLASAEGQAEISGLANPESFEDQYRAAVINPNNYSTPRQIRLGLIFSF